MDGNEAKPAQYRPIHENETRSYRLCRLDQRFLNTVISHLKTSFSGTFHALRFEKYADRYLGAFCYRFNRRFNLEEMMGRIFRATCNCTARPERLVMSVKFTT